MRFKVARTANLPPGATKSVMVEGGKIWREGVLDCPWHHFEWDLRTCENIFPKSVYPLNAMPRLWDQVRTLPTYQVILAGEDLEVEIPVESLPGREQAKEDARQPPS